VSTLRLATIAGLCAATLAACGVSQASTASGPAAGAKKIRADVMRVWDGMYDASRQGDGKRFCRHATAKYARGLAASTETDTCAEAVRTIGRYVREAVPAGARPRYSRFSTRGKRASIRVTLSIDGGPLRNDVRFRFVDGEWKVDGDSTT